MDRFAKFYALAMKNIAKKETYAQDEIARLQRLIEAGQSMLPFSCARPAPAACCCGRRALDCVVACLRASRSSLCGALCLQAA
jgi:hypothetical protein